MLLTTAELTKETALLATIGPAGAGVGIGTVFGAPRVALSCNPRTQFCKVFSCLPEEYRLQLASLHSLKKRSEKEGSCASFSATRNRFTSEDPFVHLKAFLHHPNSSLSALDPGDVNQLAFQNEESRRVVEFLHSLGCMLRGKRHMPVGVLLFGPPGKGKTPFLEMLARGYWGPSRTNRFTLDVQANTSCRPASSGAKARVLLMDELCPLSEKDLRLFQEILSPDPNKLRQRSRIDRSLPRPPALLLSSRFPPKVLFAGHQKMLEDHLRSFCILNGPRTTYNPEGYDVAGLEGSLPIILLGSLYFSQPDRYEYLLHLAHTFGVDWTLALSNAGENALKVLRPEIERLMRISTVKSSFLPPQSLRLLRNLLRLEASLSPVFYVRWCAKRYTDP